MNIQTKTAAVLFGGIGGESAGLLRSQVEFGGKLYCFKLLCSIDSDPVANQNHDLITGEKTAVTMDLFRRWQYEAWHGCTPPAAWQEVTPYDVWQAFQEQVPFFLFLSPPCKGLSGLLPQAKSESDKYQALNYLTVSGLELSLRACDEYGDKIPAVIQLENVPRITSRGKSLLKRIEKLLVKYGYEVSIRADHNLGEIGGLGQKRIRFLLMARDPKQIPNVIYYPEKKPMKVIGDVLAQLPMPGDTNAGGPLHKLPKLQWKTWMRLALIPAGGDWRDLNTVDYESLRVIHKPRSGAYEVAAWDKTSRAVTSTAGPGCSNGVTAVSDPRLQISGDGKTNLLRLQSADDVASCITGAAGVNQGGACIADPRVPQRAGRYTDQYRMQSTNKAAGTVTGSTDVQNGVQLIADPRISSNPRADTMGVQSWDQISKTITGSMDVHAGAAAVADPRAVPLDVDRGVWVIIAQDGTWHRPLTTYELAMLQSFPQYLPDGRPFQLAGCSDAKAREYIGNAVPRDSAEQMGNTVLLAGAEAEAGVSFRLSWDPVWVAPDEIQEAILQ